MHLTAKLAKILQIINRVITADGQSPAEKEKIIENRRRERKCRPASYRRSKRRA